MAAAYPRNRSDSHANHVISLLSKSCAAEEIGIDGCWLVTCIAMAEHSKKYSGPVRFWSAQLLPVLGMKDYHQLRRTRKKAVAAEWLCFQNGNKGMAAKYWSIIPKEAKCLSLEEGQQTTDPQVSGVTGAPKAHPKRTSTKSRTKKLGKSPSTTSHRQFLDWYKIYPRKMKPRDAERAYEKAVDRLMTDREWDREIAVDYLEDRADIFAKSDRGTGNYCPYPASYLNSGEYDSDPAEWNRTPDSAPRPKAAKSRVPTKRDMDHYDPHSPTGLEPGYIPEEQ